MLTNFLQESLKTFFYIPSAGIREGKLAFLCQIRILISNADIVTVFLNYFYNVDILY